MKSDKVTGLCSFILADPRFSLLLFYSISRKLDMLLYSKAYSSYRNERDVKAINILQALTCLVKPLIDLIAFPHLGQIFNLDFIRIITL